MITKRGKRVRAIALLGLIVGAIYLITHLWWGVNGPCLGTMEKCEQFTATSPIHTTELM